MFHLLCKEPKHQNLINFDKLSHSFERHKVQKSSCIDADSCDCGVFFRYLSRYLNKKKKKLCWSKIKTEGRRPPGKSGFRLAWRNARSLFGRRVPCPQGFLHRSKNDRIAAVAVSDPSRSARSQPCGAAAPYSPWQSSSIPGDSRRGISSSHF